MAALLSLPAIIVPACAGGDSNSFTGGLGGSGGAATTSATTGGNAGNGGDGGRINKPDSGPCDDKCKGGVCLKDGTCCDDPKNVCADACCKTGTVCLFDQCVTPGKECHTTTECGTDAYCETALGDGGGGPADAGTDGSCTQPPPLPGRCLPRPPVCVGDAGSPDGGCVPDCEYHPPVGPLNAVPKWKWETSNAHFQPTYADVWSTPAIGRIYDSNCDGKVDENDPPNVVFVSGNATDFNGVGNSCESVVNDAGVVTPQCGAGILRMLDGSTGKEIWSIEADGTTGQPLPGKGFAGLSTAIGDIDGDGRMDIIAATGDGHIVMVDATGHIVRTSNLPIPLPSPSPGWGWGGAMAIGDMDGDGFPEIAYGATVFGTKNNTITKLWTGASGIGGGTYDRAVSTFVDLDGDGYLELLAGCTAYKPDGEMLWDRCADTGDGFSAAADFDGDGKPEVVLVSHGNVWLLNGATGVTLLGPQPLVGGGTGGPPTIADFDGDGKPEIGVASKSFYFMLKPNFVMHTIDVIWSKANHDYSSSITGSSVFDFDGDGKAEVVYADECFLWVFDGATGNVRFAASHSSFTATEASLVADIDGDGHAEMLMISNSSNPGTTVLPGDPKNDGFGCQDAEGVPVTVNGVQWVPGSYQEGGYRGLVLFGDQANSWVGTRTLWNQHTYHVSNICDDRDNACAAPNTYGSIPKVETPNWSLPWLNDFRQNVQDKGIFDAPDATVTLSIGCTPEVAHAFVRNIGLASLPSPVTVGIFMKANGEYTKQVGTGATDHALLPGQTETLDITVSSDATTTDTLVARIIPDADPKYHECRTDNNETAPIKPNCVAH